MAIGRQSGVRPRQVAKKSEALNSSKLHFVDGISLSLGRRSESLAGRLGVFMIGHQSDPSPTDSCALRLDSLVLDSLNSLPFCKFLLISIYSFFSLWKNFPRHFKPISNASFFGQPCSVPQRWLCAIRVHISTSSTRYFITSRQKSPLSHVCVCCTVGALTWH